MHIGVEIVPNYFSDWPFVVCGELDESHRTEAIDFSDGNIDFDCLLNMARFAAAVVARLSLMPVKYTRDILTEMCTGLDPSP